MYRGIREGARPKARKTGKKIAGGWRGLAERARGGELPFA
jgi:hypothetical protein